MSTTKFDTDTAVTEGRATVSEDWFVVRGPNGGYLAAMLVKALDQAVAPGRRPRSLTIHYTAAPVAGPVEITTTVERDGRSFTFLSARMEQGGKLMANALAAYSGERDGMAWREQEMPDVPRPDSIEPLRRQPPIPPFAWNWEMRPVTGALPFTGADRAESGGWIRLLEPRALDHPLVAALTDAWFPAAFARLTAPEAVPTVDLTIHFRGDPAVVPAGEHVLALFRSRHAGGGFVEEDGVIWAPDGTLLAQSRQLALLQGASQA